MIARMKAFIIATISIFSEVIFKRKKIVHLKIKIANHKLFFSFLKIMFDARIKPNGDIFLNLRQRRKANYERGI